MKKFSDVDPCFTDQAIRRLAARVIDQAIQEARKGDLKVISWMVTETAQMFADAIEIEEGALGKMAGEIFLEFV